MVEFYCYCGSFLVRMRINLGMILFKSVFCMCTDPLKTSQPAMGIWIHRLSFSSRACFFQVSKDGRKYSWFEILYFMELLRTQYACMGSYDMYHFIENYQFVARHVRFLQSTWFGLRNQVAKSSGFLSPVN